MIHKVFAQPLSLPWDGQGSAAVKGPVAFTDISGVINKAVPYVFAAAGIGLLLMLVRSGFSFLTSAGDAKKLEEGKQRMTYAIIGFLVIFAAYWIVQILGKIFGLEGIQESFR